MTQVRGPHALAQIPKDFIHRVRRTGRMGPSGRASSLVAGAEIGELRSMERVLKLKMARRQLDGTQAPQRAIQNTLRTRTLTRLPGEVFS